MGSFIIPLFHVNASRAEVVAVLVNLTWAGCGLVIMTVVQLLFVVDSMVIEACPSCLALST
jgi:hypothetical protein